MTAPTRLYLIAFPFGHLANDWAPSCIWLLAPAIALSMGLSPGDVGLLITLYSVGASLAYLPAGLLADRVRNRGLLLAATFWWVAIGFLVASQAPNFWVLACVLAIAGMGDAAWHPIATGVMVEEMPERRAQVLGIHAMGGTLAEVLAPLSVGFMLAWLDWRTVLAVSVLPAVVMGLVFIRLAARVTPSKREALSVRDIVDLVNVWRRPSGVRLMCIIIIYNMSLMAIYSMTPLMLQNVHDFSPAEAGTTFAAMLLVGTLIQPLMGHWSDRVGRKSIVTLALTIGAILTVVVAAAGQTFVLVGALIVATGILTGMRVVVLAAMVEVARHREATTLGLAFMVMDGVGALGALLAGLVGSVDLRYPFLLSAGLAGTAAVLTMTHTFASAKPESATASEPTHL